MIKGVSVADCDGHVAEPFSLYEEYCDPAFRERVPKRIDKDGVRRVVVDGQEYPNFVKYGGRPLGMENDAKIPRPVQLDVVSQGGVDPQIRLRDMDVDGIDVAIVYPSGATSMCAIEDPGLESAVYRAYNRWVAEYCSANTERLKAVVLISLRHPELGVRELERVVDEPWVAGIVVPNHIDEYNLDHPRFNPIFDAAQTYDLPLCFHSGAGRPPYALGTNECSNNLFLMHAFAHSFEQMRTLASLIGGGVFDRYPRLRSGFIECGVGWIPWWLGCLEDHAKNLPGHVPYMKRRPIEYLQAGHCFINCLPEEATLESVVQLIGDDNIVYGSDYPHWDCGFPGSVERVGNRKLAPESLRKILWDNGARLHTRIKPIKKPQEPGIN